jgi:hypothetical protein
MSVNNLESTTSEIQPRVRTIRNPFPQDNLCRYMLSGNRRCQRVRGCTGSGLCILHDRQLNQLRDAESRSLGQEALGKVTDFNSAISIHAVLSRVVILGLQRRYTTKEVSVFTYAIQSLRQTLDEAAYEIRSFHGHDARDPYIGRALANEPSLRRPRQRTARASQDSADANLAAAQSPVGAGLGRDSGQAPPSATTGASPDSAQPLIGAPPTQMPSTPQQSAVFVDPSDIADVFHSGYISSRSQESVDNLLKRSPNSLNVAEKSTLDSIRTGLTRIKNRIDSVKQSLVSAVSSVGAGLGRDSAQAPPSAAATPIATTNTAPIPEIPAQSTNEIPQQQSKTTNAEPSANESAAEQDFDDDSIPYIHMQSYGGITVPLAGRLHGGLPPSENKNTFEKMPRPVKFFRRRRPNY